MLKLSFAPPVSFVGWLQESGCRHCLVLLLEWNGYSFRDESLSPHYDIESYEIYFDEEFDSKLWSKVVDVHARFVLARRWRLRMRLFLMASCEGVPWLMWFCVVWCSWSMDEMEQARLTNVLRRRKSRRLGPCGHIISKNAFTVGECKRRLGFVRPTLLSSVNSQEMGSTESVSRKATLDTIKCLLWTHFRHPNTERDEPPMSFTPK